MSTPKKAYLNLQEEVRQQIESKAIALYGRMPYQEVTARVLCDELEINPATLYRWFESKDELYIYLMKTVMDKIAIPADTEWSMDDFLIQDTSSGNGLREEEMLFSKSWIHAPGHVMWELIRRSSLSEQDLVRCNLERMKRTGEIRADIDVELTTYIYNTIVYNIQSYIAAKGIEDEEEVVRIQRYVYYSLFRLGIKGHSD